MLKIKRNKIIEKWFYNKINILDVLKLVKYNQVKYNHFLFIKDIDFYTIHINLEEQENSIFKNFKKNTKYEINRAKREGAKIFHLTLSKEEYLNYYNAFAKTKNLSILSDREISYYWDNLIILGGGISEDTINVINSYLVNGHRARLFHSISIFRYSKNINKNFAGMVNRFLHWEAMKYFKKNDYKIYDLGGISKIKATENIAKFKLNFSNNIVKEYNLISPLLFLLLKLKGYK